WDLRNAPHKPALPAKTPVLPYTRNPSSPAIGAAASPHLCQLLSTAGNYHSDVALEKHHHHGEAARRRSVFASEAKGSVNLLSKKRQDPRQAVPTLAHQHQYAIYSFEIMIRRPWKFEEHAH
ncbi:hypothetical protein EJB05_37617, partial [Eragrostis curvula]